MLGLTFGCKAHKGPRTLNTLLTNPPVVIITGAVHPRGQVFLVVVDVSAVFSLRVLRAPVIGF